MEERTVDEHYYYSYIRQTAAVLLNLSALTSDTQSGIMTPMSVRTAVFTAVFQKRFFAKQTWYSLRVTRASPELI